MKKKKQQKPMSKRTKSEKKAGKPAKKFAWETVKKYKGAKPPKSKLTKDTII